VLFFWLNILTTDKYSMAIYKGFSSTANKSKFRLTDFELARQDLLNHLTTKKGERLMNPNFGSAIWGMLFEPLTGALQQEIVDDLTTIINADPRISADRIEVSEFEHGIRVNIELTYLQTNETASMLVDFTKQTTE
jgi:phage baseplate assembly protein W